MLSIAVPVWCFPRRTRARIRAETSRSPHSHPFVHQSISNYEKLSQIKCGAGFFDALFTSVTTFWEKLKHHLQPVCNRNFDAIGLTQASNEIANHAVR
jgi:hypothetical protein